ncbi:DUF3617 domain-containing protein [uncultured Ramlibacter sp.]|uniref:DUF3617 domain-containing protein n=1 Tax=uncultured Ramlibacter sp. TaxID=260755 RepID=UPI002607E689|nr:DUF3617 domain-containing protein [uncultured Ramlibacter sp.]
MTMYRLIAALAALLCLPAAAQNLKPGLWELSNKMQSSNPQMEQAMTQMKQQMASMSPAQRKQMEEMLAKQGMQMGSAGPGAMSVKVCMTKEMLERNGVPAQQQGSCKTTAHPRVGNTQKISFSCTDPQASGEGLYTFTSPEAYSGRTVMTSTRQGKAETITMDGAGKWLSADCGAIQPVQPAATKK